MTACMIELHYDTCFDLLSAKKQMINVDNNHIVRGQTFHNLESEQDIINLAKRVEERATRATNMNDSSSRSHCITSFRLTRLENQKILVNKFDFVDFAGSERVNEAHNPAINNKNHLAGIEGIFINWTLTQFARCVVAVKQNQKVPFRDCLLTRVLKEALVGKSLLNMIVTIYPSHQNASQSRYAMFYGQDIAGMKKQVMPNEWIDANKILEQARIFIKEAGVRKIGDQPASKFEAIRQAEKNSNIETVRLLEAWGVGQK